jgi:hypothetical protein
VGGFRVILVVPCWRDVVQQLTFTGATASGGTAPALSSTISVTRAPGSSNELTATSRLTPEVDLIGTSGLFD